MKGIFLFTGYFLPLLICGQNLVPNASFEEYLTCPGSYSRIKEEFRIKEWYAANEGTPDAFNSCATGGGGVPYNWAGVSEAYDGKGYAGIYLWIKHREFREYIQCQLASGLIEDSTYLVSFRFRLSSYSRFVVDRIGLHLSDSAIRLRNDRSWKISPSLSVKADSALHPETGLWEYASMEYKAKGGEKFVTIGNFAADSSMSLYELMHRPPQEPMVQDAAYYYIDDVVVRMKFDPLIPEMPAPVFSSETFALDETYVLNNILFEFDSYKLLRRSFDQLEDVVTVLVKNPSVRVRISGYTDDVGSATYNQLLSERRAASVALYLVRRGVSEDRIETFGFGKRFPLLEGAGEEVQKVNRRVEVKFFR